MPDNDAIFAQPNEILYISGLNNEIRTAERTRTNFGKMLLGIAVFSILCGVDAAAQNGTVARISGFALNLAQDAGSTQLAPPTTITFQDALKRASRNDASYLSAVTDAKLAREDRVQARAALLPSLAYTQQFLGTQGNGVSPIGRYVTNDGVHVYRLWSVVHQDMPAGFFTLSPYRRAIAAQALAAAKAEIARRGLKVAVTKNYYSLIVAQRKYATAEQSLSQAQVFLDTTRLLEQGGEVARSDVVKARLQFDQQRLALQEAQLAMDNSRLALAVLLSPTLDLNFIAIDDLDQAPVLAPFAEVRAMAERENQDVRAAIQMLRQASSDVTIARAGFFPTFTLDGDYGIEANAIALRSTVAAAPQLGPLPNLGYFVTATVNVPVWNWGATLSRLHQAEYRQQQARIELSQTQRQALSNLYSFYNEATVARSEAQTLREATDLAAESLRLTALRYQSGEATALEVVDAQNVLVAARNAYDDGQARYRVALAMLETLTGKL